MKQYEAIVLGGGPGGYVAALRLAKNGVRTALVERGRVGGVCLNQGCIPTKALLASAGALRVTKRGAEFGFSTGEVAADYAAAHRRSRRVVDRLAGGVKGLLQKNGVELITAGARFTAPGGLVTDGGEELSAPNIIIATGSGAARIPAMEGAGAALLYPADALALTEAPRSAMIIGAGAIGIEFASLWSAYGCQVTIVELADRVLPGFDGEISAFLLGELRKQGIEILLGAKATATREEQNGAVITVTESGRERGLRAEKLLVSAGIRPNSDELGLELAGVATDGRGYIPVDSDMRTNARGIYAIGDVTGLLPLAHTASAQGVKAADAIAGKATEPLRYNEIPRCVYGFPEAAMIGLTEEQCRDYPGGVSVGRYPFAGNGKALGEGESSGFVKVIAAADTKEILGVHMAGAHVSELIAQCAILMRCEVTADEVMNVVFPHPSVSEVLLEAIGDAGGTAIHK